MTRPEAGATPRGGSGPSPQCTSAATFSLQDRGTACGSGCDQESSVPERPTPRERSGNAVMPGRVGVETIDTPQPRI